MLLVHGLPGHAQGVSDLGPRPPRLPRRADVDCLESFRQAPY
jgi:hypothetical protein